MAGRTTIRVGQQPHITYMCVNTVVQETDAYFLVTANQRQLSSKDVIKQKLLFALLFGVASVTHIARGVLSTMPITTTGCGLGWVFV